MMQPIADRFINILDLKLPHPVADRLRHCFSCELTCPGFTHCQIGRTAASNGGGQDFAIERTLSTPDVRDPWI